MNYSHNCIYFLYQGCVLELQLACDVYWDFILKLEICLFKCSFNVNRCYTFGAC